MITPFHCADCARRIGATRSHHLMGDGRIICSRCRITPPTRNTTQQCSGTRAGIAALLRKEQP